jgi:formylglycine-generating enzyme required for sulfatase activity
MVRRTIGESKGALGRGDLLRLLNLGMTPDAAGGLLGYRAPEPAVRSDQPQTDAKSEGTISPRKEIPDQATGETPETPVLAPRLWRATGPKLAEADASSQIPKFLLTGTACSEEELSNRTADAPPVRPLLSKARLGVTLRGLLLRETETDQVDVDRLVDALARCQALPRLPRCLRRSWPARVQVLWDDSPALRPLRPDQAQVVQWLRRWHGLLGLEELVVGENGSVEWHRRVGRGPTGRVAVQVRRGPDNNTTILALSDLGFLNPAREEDPFWASQAEQGERAGARCRALVPGPASRWNRQLARRWNARDWEHGNVRSLLAVRHRPRAAILDRLFVLLSPAAWVDWPLLRQVRRLLDCEGAGVATEIEAWMDNRVTTRFAPTGFLIEPKTQQELRARFLALPAQERADLAAVLCRWHAHLGLVPRAEELLSLGDASLRDKGVALLASYACLLRDRDGIPEPVESAFATVVENRQGPSAWVVEELLALWALHHAGQDRFDAPLPEGVEPHQVIWALKNLPKPTAWLLFQKGNALRLLPGAGLPATRDLGSLLTQIQSRLPRLEARWHTAGGETRRAMLESGGSFELPFSSQSPEVWRVEVVGDLGKAEIGLEPHPDWADRFWRDSNGLWVDTRVRGFKWDTGTATVQIGKTTTPSLTVESEDLPSRLLWPTWATRLSKDEYGIRAELELESGPEKRVAICLRWIPPGRFLMGSPKDEKGRFEQEGPQHWVTLTQGFWLADAPCTQAEWRAVMGTAPSHQKGEKLREEEREKLPVEQVSWEECQQFCEKLRARFPGLQAMLPSEAQWEYACRAGTASAFNDGSGCTNPGGHDPALAKLGWFDENSGRETKPVRGLAPNQWGLHDMHGNVWEWCQDWFGSYTADDQENPTGAASGVGRVLRGGSWGSAARYCRSAFRFGWSSGDRYRLLGFRLASGQSGQVSQASQERADGKQAGRRPAAPVGERATKARRK